MDPFATALAAGAAGGIASKLTSITLDVGTKWVRSYYQDHYPDVVVTAELRSKEFIQRLALKVDRLEEESELNKAMLETTFKEPSFAALLQRAIIGAAQTDSAEKHDIVATLVAERLIAPCESLLAVVRLIKPRLKVGLCDYLIQGPSTCPDHHIPAKGNIDDAHSFHVRPQRFQRRKPLAYVACLGLFP